MVHALARIVLAVVALATRTAVSEPAEPISPKLIAVDVDPVLAALIVTLTLAISIAVIFVVDANAALAAIPTYKPVVLDTVKILPAANVLPVTLTLAGLTSVIAGGDVYPEPAVLTVAVSIRPLAVLTAAMVITALVPPIGLAAVVAVKPCE